MLDQNRLLRRLSLGSFDTMLRELTRDPAMLLWLSGTENTKWSPNENYARELMELFTLGAGRGYSEQDVREQARALTGFDNDCAAAPAHNFRFDPKRHDAGRKRIFGRAGDYDWQDAVRLCLRHPQHASFFVDKLWGYFVPTAPDRDSALARAAVRDGHQIRPVLEAILRHPALPHRPRMVKPPVVYTAGLLRAWAAGSTRTRGPGLASQSGQRQLPSPNVAGGTTRAARHVDLPRALARRQPRCATAHRQAGRFAPGRAAGARRRRDRLLGLPDAPPGDEEALLAFARRAMGDGDLEMEADELPLPRRERPAAARRGLPDLQTS